MHLRGDLAPRWTDSPDPCEAEAEVAIDHSVNAILDGAGVCTSFRPSSDLPTEPKRVPPPWEPTTLEVKMQFYPDRPYLTASRYGQTWRSVMVRGSLKAGLDLLSDKRVPVPRGLSLSW